MPNEITAPMRRVTATMPTMRIVAIREAGAGWRSFLVNTAALPYPYKQWTYDVDATLTVAAYDPAELSAMWADRFRNEFKMPDVDFSITYI